MDLDASSTALHVDGFDAEQIWGQLDTSGVALLRRARKLMARSEEAETLLLPAAAARLEGARASQMACIQAQLCSLRFDERDSRFKFVVVQQGIYEEGSGIRSPFLSRRSHGQWGN